MNATTIKQKLDLLEAERLILTVELRNALVKEAKRLLPLAISQASRKKNPSPSPAPPDYEAGRKAARTLAREIGPRQPND